MDCRLLCPVYPHLEYRVRAPSALYSRQRYAAPPSLLCRLPLVLLQAAAAARIAGKHGIVAAAKSGDVADVLSYLIARANCVNQYNGS